MHSVGEAVIEDGRLTRFIGNTLDITEQEELTQELRRREACLTQAEALEANQQTRLSKREAHITPQQ